MAGPACDCAAMNVWPKSTPTWRRPAETPAGRESDLFVAARQGREFRPLHELVSLFKHERLFIKKSACCAPLYGTTWLLVSGLAKSKVRNKPGKFCRSIKPVNRAPLENGSVSRSTGMPPRLRSTPPARASKVRARPQSPAAADSYARAEGSRHPNRGQDGLSPIRSLLISCRKDDEPLQVFSAPTMLNEKWPLDSRATGAAACFGVGRRGHRNHRVPDKPRQNMQRPLLELSSGHFSLSMLSH